LNKWNKKNQPPESDDKIVKKVERLYSNPVMNKGITCNQDPTLKKFCQSDCDLYKQIYKAQNLGDKKTFLDCLRNACKPVTYSDCKKALGWIFIPEYVFGPLYKNGTINIPLRNNELVFELI